MHTLVVLASGNGSNLQAVLEACASGELPAGVAAMFSDRPGAYALERARQAGVPALAFPWLPYEQAGRDRPAYDADLAAQVSSFRPDLVILAGWMRILTHAFISCFPMQILNLHPAMPGAFPGTHAIQRAWEAYQAGGIQSTGVMVHFVPDEGVDTGPVVAVEPVPIGKEDTLATLEDRIHRVEHRLLVSAIKMVLESRQVPDP